MGHCLSGSIPRISEVEDHSTTLLLYSHHLSIKVAHRRACWHFGEATVEMNEELC